MIFSTILSNINSIKQARKHGLPVAKYKITLHEIKEDFAKMEQLQSTALTKMSAERCQAFSREIELFFQTLSKLFYSENALTAFEKNELEGILEETRIIRDNVKSVAKKFAQINSETDNQF